MRDVLDILAVELGSDMVIRVFYGFGDWEFLGANCFVVVDCDVMTEASQMI